MTKRETHKISRLTCNRCGFVFTLETGMQECPYDGTSLKEVAFDPLLGRTLDGKYEVTSQIGAGGMSLVYKARHIPTGRTVAVKTLQACLVSDELTVLRFQQEIMAMSALQHPNVVSVLDHGVTPQKQPYMVMDYVPGRPLSRLIKDKGRLDWRTALPVFIQICDALSAAHACGIIHRDIKPGNIMVVQQGLAPMLARVVDFGIAKLLYGGGQRLTRTGEVIGSPLYMSPEQCTGDPLDARTDMYALGCVMHETLTGRAPLMGVNTADMMQMALFTPPPSLSVARPDVEFPPELEEIILRMLSKQKEDRYDSLLTVREQLHTLAFKGGVYAPVPAEAPSQKRRGPGLLVEVGMGVLALILLGTAGVLWGIPMMDKYKFETLFNVGMKQFREGDYEMARRSLDDAQTLAEAMPDKGRTECRILSCLANIYEHSGSADRAERADEEIGRLAKGKIADDIEVDKIAMSGLSAADEHSAKKTGFQVLDEINYAISLSLAKARPQLAEKLALKGVEIEKEVKSTEIPPSRIYSKLALAYLAQDDLRGATGAFDKAVAAALSEKTEGGVRAASCIAVRAARALAAHGNETEASKFYDTAVKLANNQRHCPVFMREYSEFLTKIGQPTLAEKMLASANEQRFGKGRGGR